MQNSPAKSNSVGKAVQLLTLAIIALFTTACEWVPPPTVEEIFLSPPPETNFGDVTGAVLLSNVLDGTPTCYTSDGTAPFYDLASCSSGTTQTYAGAIDLGCGVDVGPAVLRVVNLAFGWPGEPGPNGEIALPTVEYRGANFYLDCGGTDPDGDGDGIPDASDNCPSVANAGQADWNTNGIGDACEDSDADLVMDDVDNCITTANTPQADWDLDGEGDACDDTDSDGVFDDTDNCISDANPGQEDDDSDGIGNACEVGGFGYYLFNPDSGSCIETISSSDVDGRACVLSSVPANQAFTITESNSAGSYTIASQSTGECIIWDNQLGTDDVDTAGCNAGSDLQQWVFTETGVGSGQFKMSPRDNSECLRDNGNLEGGSCGTTQADWEIYDKDTHALIDPNTL